LEAPLHVGTADVEDGPVQEDVLAPREFGIEAAAEFEQRGDPSRHGHLSSGGSEGSGDDLQQGALAAPVTADDADGDAALDLEGHVPERPELAPVAPAEAPEQLLLQAVLRAIVQAVHLPGTAHRYHDRQSRCCSVLDPTARRPVRTRSGGE